MATLEKKTPAKIAAATKAALRHQEINEAPGWRPLGRHIIGASIGQLIGATVTVACLGAFIPIPGWEGWANPVLRGLIVFVGTAILLWGGLWLGYPPMSIDLRSKRLRWRGVDVAFDDLVRFEIRLQSPYVTGRLTTRDGRQARVVLHGEPTATAGIGRDGRELLARAIEGSSVTPRAVDPSGFAPQELAALNARGWRKRWQSLDIPEAAYELTGVHPTTEEGALLVGRRPLIPSHVEGNVPSAKVIRGIGFTLVVTAPVVIFFAGAFALLPPYFEREVMTWVLFIAVVAFAAGIWCFSLARERLERLILEDAGLRQVH